MFRASSLIHASVVNVIREYMVVVVDRFEKIIMVWLVGISRKSEKSKKFVRSKVWTVNSG